MEPANLIAEEWGSLSGQFTAEEADFMAQLLGVNFSVTEKHCVNTSFGTNSNSYFPSNVSNTNFLCFSQGSNSSNGSSTGNIFSTTTSSGTYSCDQATNIDSLSMVFCLGDDKISPHSFPWVENLSQNINESIHEGSVKLVLAENNLQAKGEQEMMVSEPSEEDRSKNLENPAKRFRNSIEVSTNTRNARKSPKDPEAPNLYRKSRATSGPATDAQSMYARRRRERINERLRILQNLVPNGTKVDISTMLEEAVQYVKFLQLQIKLLSSDDLWMYAPIAYNGINIGIGLDLSISPTNGR